jgi:glycosyltransferase involved in cell wall biosynthesis
MLGTDPLGAGGIAAVICAYRQAGMQVDDARSALACAPGSARVAYLATHRSGAPLFGIPLWLRVLPILLQLRWRNELRVVHVHSASRGSFWRKSILLWVARCLGSKTVLHIHGGGFQRFVEHECGTIAKAWVKHTVRRSTVVVALSESWRNYFLGLAPQARVQVVLNPVQIQAHPIRQPEPRRILFLGRVVPAKGVFDLLEVLAHQRARLADSGGETTWTLVVGGDGQLVDLMRRAEELGVAGQIECLGWIDQAEKSRQFARASVFVLPSYDEGLPLSMLEAMAAFVPVVVSPVGGVTDLIVNRLQGVLAPAGDVQAWLEAIGLVLSDHQLAESMASAAFERVQRTCEANLVVQQIEAIWDCLSPHEDAGPMPAVISDG